MSDLERFRDHCRAMASTEPSPADTRGPWCRHFAGIKPNHDRGAEVAPPGRCGCTCHPWNAMPTDKDRALWTRLADEVDAYLTPEDAPLWEDA